MRVTSIGWMNHEYLTSRISKTSRRSCFVGSAIKSSFLKGNQSNALNVTTNYFANLASQIGFYSRIRALTVTQIMLCFARLTQF